MPLATALRLAGPERASRHPGVAQVINTADIKEADIRRAI
jgi:hypothetical protein